MQPENNKFNNKLDVIMLKSILDEALREDYGIRGDITSNATIADNKTTSFKIASRNQIILAGIDIADYYFKNYSTIKYKKMHKDGAMLSPGDTIIRGVGLAREVLLLERIILNFMQHLSGIATLTNQYVDKVKDSNAKICDTRKTIPGLRTLQKYAVSCGGGHNHRLAMDSAIMIKDNHIAICGSITKAVELAKKANPHYGLIEVECDTIKQVEESLRCGVDIIMLDNMKIEVVKEAVGLIGKQAIIEASGGVKLETVAAIAATGVDYISVGRLTSSAPAADIGLDIEI